MKYIDAEKLITEIERQKSLFSTEKEKEGLSKTDRLSLGARIASLEETIVLINALQQEQPSLPDNLDEAAHNWAMKASVVYIKKAIIDRLNKEITVIDIRSFNGYYLFEFGEDSVTHFSVNGCKGWKFAFWITQDQKNEKKFLIEMFGQYIKYIDKFKPSASPFSFSAKIESIDEINELGTSIDIKIAEFTNVIKSIMKNPVLRRWAIYTSDAGYQNGFLKWWINDILQYKFIDPFDDFVEIKLTKAWLKVVAYVYTKKFKTRKNKFHVNLNEEQIVTLRRALHINPASGKLHELKENEVCILQSLLRELEKL